MPATPPILTEKDRQASRQISEHTLKVARPLYWHVGMKNGGVPEGASAFILQFEDRFIGITADHVIELYMKAQAEDSRMLCQLGYAQIFPERCIIARSETLDIATFRVDPAQLPEIEADVINCTGRWPPPEVKVGDAINMTGFLNNHRTKKGPQHYEMAALGANCIVDAVSAMDIVTVYVPEEVVQASFAEKKPPLGFNMSGCSGGPVLLYKQVNGVFQWFPVGLIYKGPGGNAEGEFASFDRIHARRLHFIQPDGSIREPESGWLPKSK